MRTIDMNTYGKSSGKGGSYSTNYQLSGRELFTPDEVRLMKNEYAILFIRGEKPILDLKYDIMKHPNVAFTADGTEETYSHGEPKNVTATITFLSAGDNEAGQELCITDMDIHPEEYEIVNGEEFLKYV